jgi:hypothetical protein
MNVKELITQLLSENMDADVFVVVDVDLQKMHSPTQLYFEVDGISAFRTYRGKTHHVSNVTLETTGPLEE